MAAFLDKEKKIKKAAIWWWMGGGAAVVALLFAGIAIYNKPSDMINNQNQAKYSSVSMPEVIDGLANVFDETENKENSKFDATTQNAQTKPKSDAAHLEFVNTPNGKQNAAQRFANSGVQNANEIIGNSSNVLNAKPKAGGHASNGTEHSANIARQVGYNQSTFSVELIEINANNNLNEQLSLEQPSKSENLNFERLTPVFPNMLINSAFHDKEKHLHQVNIPEANISKWQSHVGVIAGAIFGRNFPNSEEFVGGMGSHLGLRFQYAPLKGFMLHTGLSFAQNQINGLVYEETRKVFGYEQYDLVNTIKYQNMFCANVPLFVGYQGQKFSIAAGLKLNFILNTKGRVYTWDNSVVDQSVWGYAHGIKYFNMIGGTEATYRLARRWHLGWSFDLDLSPRSQLNNDLISPSAQLWQTGLFVKYRLN
jgi:hypothetical protein